MSPLPIHWSYFSCLTGRRAFGSNSPFSIKLLTLSSKVREVHHLFSVEKKQWHIYSHKYHGPLFYRIGQA
jgi:hypothetical protein